MSKTTPGGMMPHDLEQNGEGQIDFKLHEQAIDKLKQEIKKMKSGVKREEEARKQWQEAARKKDVDLKVLRE